MLLACHDAAFAYEGRTVVDGLNFSIDNGNYLCVVGENGSGKSTLIKGLLHLKQPQKGSIIYETLQSTEIGYLPQQTDVQKDFPASVYEIALSGRLGKHGLLPFYTQNDKNIARKNLELLGIGDLQKRCYRELSGGQQQRTLLARALCATCKLLLLDEPVAGLDPLVTQEFYQLVEKINKENNITVIMVTHDIHSAIKYASHILHLKNQQAFFGTTREYLRSSLGSEFLRGF